MTFKTQYKLLYLLLLGVLLVALAAPLAGAFTNTPISASFTSSPSGSELGPTNAIACVLIDPGGGQGEGGGC